jgi:hypothetical protein
MSPRVARGNHLNSVYARLGLREDAPVLDIAFLKLSGCAKEEMFVHQVLLGMDERHRILKLIAETEGAPRLIVSAPRPQTARERLVQEPAVGQHIQ